LRCSDDTLGETLLSHHPARIRTRYYRDRWNINGLPDGRRIHDAGGVFAYRLWLSFISRERDTHVVVRSNGTVPSKRERRTRPYSFAWPAHVRSPPAMVTDFTLQNS
jgi:hypothetical protein